MELGEATALAGTFITSLLFRVHSLPTNDRSGWAAEWWRSRGSRIPLRPALDEAARHLGHFTSRRRVDKKRDRQLFLEISAIADDDGQGRCPALADNLCGIYETRPLTCRTVPMHYSRAPSTLGAYLDRFTATPGYRCDTTPDAPVILDGNKVIDVELRDNREQAIACAKADRRWKDRLVELMDDDAQAAAAGLPSYDAVVSNSDNGYASLQPMIVAWRVARQTGLLTAEALTNICRKQAGLIRERIARDASGRASKERLDLLAMYEAENAKAERLSAHSLLGGPSSP
jgi:Fe-S-cluster containining protein